jgi:hypothetical protein
VYVCHRSMTLFIDPCDDYLADDSLPSCQLQLLHPLEATYHARYKSDYFSQNGHSRRPRYIADNAGHHDITIRVRITSID